MTFESIDWPMLEEEAPTVITATAAPARPLYSLRDLDVLDVGCGDGQLFGDACFQQARSRLGVDIDFEAIGKAQKSAIDLDLFQCGAAEHLPICSSSIDVFISRVALPYTHLPTALAEAARVTRPAGYIFLTMHDPRLQWEFFWTALKAVAWIRCIDHLIYILPASLVFNLCGWCLPRPWNGLYETFQTRRRMLKELKKAGFVATEVERRGRHIVYQAKRSVLGD